MLRILKNIFTSPILNFWNFYAMVKKFTVIAIIPIVVFLIYRFVIKKRRTNYIDSIGIDLNANMELK